MIIGSPVAPVVAHQAQRQATQGRDLSTPASLETNAAALLKGCTLLRTLLCEWPELDGSIGDTSSDLPIVRCPLCIFA